MPLPNLICAGALRSGTTYLYHLLRAHPDICLSEPKETNFFDRDDIYHKGIIHYEMGFYSHYKGESVVGDFTPSVMFFDKAPQRIFKHLGPDVKFVFSLRNPVERAYSHYIGGYKDLKECETFDRALELEPERISEGFYHRWSYGYLERGYYARQLKPFLELFPSENMFFIILEQDWGENGGRTSERLQKFLGVDKHELGLEQHRHARYMDRARVTAEDIGLMRDNEKTVLPAGSILVERKKSIAAVWSPSAETIGFVSRHMRNMPPMKLDPARRTMLTRKHFAEDIAELEEIIGRDLGSWLE